MTSEIEALIEARECLACLTPRQREAVRLRASGLTYREVALEMGIHVRKVYELMARAKTNIQKLNIDRQ